ncbi:hypothetical protein [Bradyrhizobium sp. CIR3A]|uniref:hypothetical protein n=1 Tax=Bradyrhizobium sp. CIR3A TaxID=2663838 RepID=UPI00160657EC|nr:hypothetical protein [Bradyrhizobium sp. CIR3A]MBB4263746.1 hypothetical protein [Bradyrhizobium sp. CIR3A]
MSEEFEDLIHRIEAIKTKMDPLLPKLAAARSAFLTSQTNQNKIVHDALQAEVEALHEESSRLIAELPRASGLPPEAFEEHDPKDDESSGSQNRLERQNLTVDQVETTADIDELLPHALQRIESLLPSSWLDQQPREAARIGSLLDPEAILSLTKNTRLNREGVGLHRLRQAVFLCRDYLEGHHLYDHFAGAELVPTVVRLATQGYHIGQVGGEMDERLRQLWQGPSNQVEATIFELLTAAACVEMGRSVEFLKATDKKSPDIRCHDPFPIVIECKRQETISQYEASEEASMRELFATLRAEAKKRGLFGTLKLTLSVEASQISINDVASKLVSQRLAAHPDRPVDYTWGTVALEPLPTSIDLSSKTRLYSPNMLQYLFGWSMDLPDWDGICCSVDLGREPVTDRVRSPIALIWRNISEGALKKRTWAPSNLFGAASFQVPAGEFGIVYVNYVEGARAEVADLRVNAYSDRLHEFEHSAKIRIPIAVLSRLYPRPLHEGQPDLIESCVRYVSGVYGEPALFKSFPTTVFTHPGA